MPTNDLTDALAALPAGRYLVAVSGGADSTALLRLVHVAGHHGIVVAHLNHELRGGESDADEAFVRNLANEIGVPCAVARLLDRPPPHLANASARYRAARLDFFRETIAAYSLGGLLLAHHADDQAESVLLRIVRGAQLPALGGMAAQRSVSGMTIFRPLLAVRREQLLAYLRSIDQPWREDVSNASNVYRRNVVRQWLAADPSLVDALLALAGASRRWHAQLDAAAPVPGESFECDTLRGPAPLAEHAAGRWLIARGSPPDAVSPATRRRLVDQAVRPAAPARQNYPGGILVRRQKNRISVVAAPPIRSDALQSRPEHGQDQATAAGEFRDRDRRAGKNPQ